MSVSELLPELLDVLLPLDPLVDELPPPGPPDEPDPDDGPELLTVDCCESTNGSAATGRACADAIVNANATTAQARARGLDLIITGPLSPTGSRLV